MDAGEDGRKRLELASRKEEQEQREEQEEQDASSTDSVKKLWFFH